MELSEFFSSIRNRDKKTTTPKDIGMHARERGVAISSALEDIFTRYKFNTYLISQHGAMLLDVGFGPEIEAVRRYRPPILIVTEELDNNHPNLTGREDSIHDLSKGMPIRLIRGYPLLGTSLVQKGESEKVGLITHLNTDPNKISSRYLRQLVTDCVDCLAPGGLALISFTQSDSQRHQREIDKVLKIKTNKTSTVSEFTLSEDQNLSAGYRFIAVSNS